MLRAEITGSPKALDRGFGRGPKVILIMANKVFQDPECLCIYSVLHCNDTVQHFLSQGVLQSWTAGTPGGDER